ncbi:flagellar hook-associated protein FlgL [Thermovibrio ammonificans]|uniref:Flagellar hook-associated protein 3 n=1 Tax=Thermovibrio ammonificans (strain DSM 15698 / JCM 12110 / HB-1) TaxID=648996 RepID=E8T3U0_THEA1|nr:flagellar hook-associated protein FlgL [Thermovibrio ammonificans]ADU97347.1 flagellar hook-associated protein 3 [Thermovibrio ammonificans HB-1]
MRISTGELFDLFIRYDRLKSAEIKRKAEELSSGKSILRPSDSPVDYARLLRLDRFVENLDRFNRNIDLVKANMDTAESALASTVQTLEAARVKIIQILNTGALNGEDAKTLADYFESVKDYVIQMGNEKVGDAYLFGGVKTQSPPFDSDGTYQGETRETTVPVANGVEVSTNYNGENYFGVNRVSGKITVVEVLDRIVQIIQSGDLSQLDSATVTVDLGDGPQTMKLLDAFDAGLSKIMEYRSILGTQVALVDDLKTQNEAVALHAKELRSKIGDADFASVISDYDKAKTAYQALLSTYTDLKQLSLLNFLK